LYYDLDFHNSYVIDPLVYNIDFINIYLVYNINTKIENSILNLKLRKISTLADTHSYYYIGATVHLNYEYVHIGLENNNLLDIYYGRHFFCYLINNNTNIHFLTGNDSFYEDSYTLQLPLSIRLNLGYNLFFHQSNLFSGDIIIKQLNIISDYTKLLLDRIEYVPKFIYLLGVELEDYELSLLSNCFITYQGHHGDLGILHSNLILPSMLYLEKKGYYMNCFGDVEYNTNILQPIATTYYSDFDILYSLLKYNRPFVNHIE
jgi:NADH-quinone oxidoreductase subunit G